MSHKFLSHGEEKERESCRSDSRPVTRHDLLMTELRLELILLAWFDQIERNITMKVGEALAAFNSNVQAAFAKLGTAVDGVAADVQGLKDQIAVLQNSTGEISAEDQATLDGIQASANTIADKVAVLDAATAPAVVPVPPPVA